MKIKKKNKLRLIQQGNGPYKIPFPVYAAPYYQRGFGAPDFWKRRVVPFWNRVKGPLSKLLLFSGNVLHDNAMGKSLPDAIGSNLLKQVKIKTKKNGKNVKRVSAMRRSGGKTKGDIFS